MLCLLFRRMTANTYIANAGGDCEISGEENRESSDVGSVELSSILSPREDAGNEGSHLQASLLDSSQGKSPSLLFMVACTYISDVAQEKLLY
jgi:hypothetical protein